MHCVPRIIRLMSEGIAGLSCAITLAFVAGCRTANAEHSEIFFYLPPPETYFDKDDDEGKLGKFKDSLREKDKETQKGDRKERGDSETWTSEDDDEEEGILDRMVEDFLYEIFVRPMVYLMTYSFACDAGYNYLSYPYESESAGYIKTIPEFGNFGFTVSTDYQYVSTSLYGLRGFFKLRYPSGAFMDTSYTRYEEELSHRYDHFNIFKFHVGYSFVRDEKFTVEPYIGSVSFPGTGIDVGFDMGISADYFFRKPLHAYVNLGNSFLTGANMADLECGFGLFYKNLEARIGYRSLISEDQDISGPVIGISLWF